ncbi:DUF3054 domain-containing protein [Microlunatus sp. Gsoil 973]|uniref:DUF3054 domain-containing protein n=1 Tax=Microlunatus sp. Gsoil 973 TaxID=2672569 RepID=UPI001E573E21|nr:DUF3054 domain-containing protein [Microlunatus sp. Gsoil 973]
MRFLGAIGLDVVVVLVFAAVGRGSHAESDTVAGILITAWPYLVAAVVGPLIALGWQRTNRRRPNHRRPTRWHPYAWRTGLVVWVTTVVLGMVLRLLAGGTAAWPFWIVAFITLGIGLLGWRLLARLVSGRARHRTDDGQPAAAITSSDASKLE